MMEQYFALPEEVKAEHARPRLHYQSFQEMEVHIGNGYTGVELPRSFVDDTLASRMARLKEGHHASTPAGADPKWRYMWRIGPRPTHTRFKELNADPVVPAGFPEWSSIMDGWGNKMIAAVETVAEMTAIGFGLDATAFTSVMKLGPHLLAPTGCDLSRASPGTIFAGYHYDLNFLTIHGRSRFPGLFIWLRNGTRVATAVPEGCLLLQAGKQLEWLTGGECQAGMHEVVYADSTAHAVEVARAAGRSLWRVSSTVFGHIASDALLQPLGHFAHASEAHKYPATLAGEYVEAELAILRLNKRTYETGEGKSAANGNPNEGIVAQSTCVTEGKAAVASEEVSHRGSEVMDRTTGH
eukprot:jgi/Chlat1/7095/Chrsp57S09122